ncbi:MAG TPA: ABC transporter permease [Vicinamibacterales bacterium]|nr:ABC transporter permease [Vicinamibacterales bacterium]
MNTWLRRLGGMFRTRQREQDLDAELNAHLESHIADNLRAGMPPDVARRRAMLTLGGVEVIKEQYRQQLRFEWIDDLRRDLVYAMRTLKRSPGFAAVAVVSLALGTGVNTLVFGVVNGLLIQALPVAQPDRVVFVQPNSSGFVATSFPNYRDLRDRNATFDGLIGYRMSPIDVEANGAPVRAWSYLATGNYFDVLGVRPAAGRFFTQADDSAPGAAPFAVLSFDFWTSQFAADPTVIGRTIRINRQPFTVIGVAPSGFIGTELFFRPSLWVPMMMEPQIEPGNNWLERRRTANTWVAGRLKPGVSVAQAEGNLKAIAADLAREYPDANVGLDFKLTRPGLVGDAFRGPARAFTLGVLVLAGLVLLTACANLASMLSARGADRAREIAVRLSIGASRGRIVRQLLTETSIVALAGGSIGYVLAHVASTALSRWRLPVDLPAQFDVRPDTRVFLFAFAVAACAGVLFGLAPARQASKIDTNAALKSADAVLTGAGRRRRFAYRDFLVAVQVALCFVLVAACLLALRGLQQTLTMPLGFKPAGVVKVGFDLGLAGYDPVRGAAFQQRAVDAVSRLPGVESAAYSNTLPLNLDQSNTTVYPETSSDQRSMSMGRMASPYMVSPEFFRTLGIPLRRGRSIESTDTASTPRVAVVNETFVRRLLRTDDPIGRRFRFGPGGPLIQVVGVVGEGKYQSLTEDPRAAVFTPILQTYNSTTTLIVRSKAGDGVTLAQVRQALHALDPSLTLYGAGGLDEMMAWVRFPSHTAAVALSVFGLLAAVLAATGIHGVVAYAVARRGREIGIRIAIGARRRDVLRLVLGRIATLVAAGSLLGLSLALLVGPLLAQIVYQASPREPLVLGGVWLAVTLIAVIASWAPAVRSLRVEPVTALRSE